MHRSAGGELAVVAVLLEPSGLPSPLIGQVVDAAPGDAGQEVEFDEGLSPLELLLEFEPQARRRRLLHLSGLTDHARVHGRRALDRPPGHPRDPERHGRAPARAHRRLPGLRRLREQQPADAAAQRSEDPAKHLASARSSTSPDSSAFTSPASVSISSRPSRRIWIAVAGSPSAVIRRPRRKSRAPSPP